MTKSKSSTIAIVALSVLLAAALAATIVLAAFNASRSATTTITFANGVEITVSGIKPLTGKTGTTENYWKYTQTTTSGTLDEAKGTVKDVTTDVKLDNIVIKSADTNAVFVIVQPVILKTKDSSGDIQGDARNVTSTAAFYQNVPTNWVALDNGWYLYKTTDDASASKQATSVTNSVEAEFPGKTITADSDTSYTAVVNIYAVSAAVPADAYAALTSYASDPQHAINIDAILA